MAAAAFGFFMARRCRLFLPDVPLHIIQRGNNRSRCFFRNWDYRLYRQWLGEYAAHCRCAVHAYVLMPNHVHLLVTPGDARGPSQFMQSLGRRYVAYINRTQGRTGTLWEGRYRASPVDSEEYLFQLYRYIELNPVRAGIVDHPSKYPWSSFMHNATGRDDDVISPHPLYTELAPNARDRQAGYRGLLGAALSDEAIALIRDAATAGLPVGPEAFHRRIERELGIRLAAPPGRKPASSPGAEGEQPSLLEYYVSDPN
jgi:putative transposase